MATFFLLFFLIIIVSSLQIHAANELSIQTLTDWGSKPGFIENARLVVQPHGGYVEQSLYLEYSDHGGYKGHDSLEIVHRFELPEGSVVNDLWLWVGDSIMQAVMMETWTARAIYDSIVSQRRDPAFLAKEGNQYELHVFPLKSGSFRKIKLNFIAPTKWQGERATASLPFRLLDADNSKEKPVKVLFKTPKDNWGWPCMLEAEEYAFQDLIDAYGFRYKKCDIPDISKYSSLNRLERTLTMELVNCWKNGK